MFFAKTLSSFTSFATDLTPLSNAMPRIPLNVAATLPRTLGPPPKPLPSDFLPTAADARSLYRSLRRVGSLSIMYSSPGHKVIREKIREAFEESRKNPAKTPQDIKEQWERGKNKVSFRICFIKEMFPLANLCHCYQHSILGSSSRSLPRVSAWNTGSSATCVLLQQRRAKGNSHVCLLWYWRRDR